MIQIPIESDILSGAIGIGDERASAMFAQDPAFDGQAIQGLLDRAQAHRKDLAELLFWRNLVTSCQDTAVDETDDRVAELDVFGETRPSRAGNLAKESFRRDPSELRIKRKVRGHTMSVRLFRATELYSTFDTKRSPLQ
jgi:hypothetical protein